MIFKATQSSIFECTLERAFKTPILCDVTKIHAGFGVMPKVIYTKNDKNWGKAGSSKKIFVAKSLTQKGGFASMDRILERVENKYWKIQIDEFQSWMLGFYKFVGEWKVTEIAERKILVEYTYFLHSKSPVFFPFNWIFAKTFWKVYMKKVMENIRIMAYNDEPYQFE